MRPALKWKVMASELKIACSARLGVEFRFHRFEVASHCWVVRQMSCITCLAGMVSFVPGWSTRAYALAMADDAKHFPGNPEKCVIPFDLWLPRWVPSWLSDWDHDLLLWGAHSLAGFAAVHSSSTCQLVHFCSCSILL